MANLPLRTVIQHLHRIAGTVLPFITSAENSKL